MANITRHAEFSGLLPGVTPAQAFAYLDDHARLSSHMAKGSWRMGGGRMDVEVDAAGGRAVGSRITLAGNVLGVPLHAAMEVIERKVPERKVWSTDDRPRLVVISPYRMGFELVGASAGSVLRVFIDYALPGAGRLVGWLGDWYARWCTRRMVIDAERALAR